MVAAICSQCLVICTYTSCVCPASFPEFLLLVYAAIQSRRCCARQCQQPPHRPCHRHSCSFIMADPVGRHTLMGKQYWSASHTHEPSKQQQLTQSMKRGAGDLGILLVVDVNCTQKTGEEYHADLQQSTSASTSSCCRLTHSTICQCSLCLCHSPG